MFLDIGSTEFLFILFLALIVLGPEKLPDVMRSIGRVIFKLKKFWNNLTADIKRDLELEELKKEMEKYKEEMKKIQNQINQHSNDINNGINSIDNLTQIGQGRDFRDILK